MGLKRALRTAQNYFPGGRERREMIVRQGRRLMRRPHDPDFAALRHFPPEKTFLDVGANYGQSIDSMLLMRPDATVIAFEANTALAATLARWFADYRRVAVRQYGLSNQSGRFDLFVPSYRNFEYPGLATVVDEQTATELLSPETLYFFRPDLVSIRRISCWMETLDAQNVAPYFIKIDVQGAEYNVLEGGRRTLEQHEPILLIENPGGDPRIRPTLASLGYQEYEFIGGKLKHQIACGTNGFFLTAARVMEILLHSRELFT